MSEGFKGLKLYNTLTRTKEDFAPIDANNVRMYVCGPTVYDFAHIGNARPVIVFDVLYRLLRHLYGAESVTYVRNITDVDDKINARALRDFPDLPLNEAIGKVTQKTADQFHADVKALGCLEPTFEPRATEFVQPRADGKADMITLIQRLIERGHAYEAEGEVLFDTASMKDYGQLSKRPLDEQQAGARVAVDRHKKNPGDFVLWKLSSAEEPGWGSPWGRGRPGWHIECSAMSAAYLGEIFDIHGGGLDLIFPHHENEIAQSRCAHGTDVMANYWLHNGFVQVEGRKMSKSEGNFVTINDLLETDKFGGRKWPGEVLRLAMLMTHYREPIDFSVRKLAEAESWLNRWRRRLDQTDGVEGEVPQAAIDALKNDLDLSKFFEVIHSMMNVGQWAEEDDASKINAVGFGEEFSGFETKGKIAHSIASAVRTLHLVGIEVTSNSNLDEVHRAAVDERLSFIAAKNWAEADRIRDELLEQGIQLKDGKDPETGERITTWEVKR
ncbi:cysteine--tRNA ligase [Mesorhizobium sp. SB112]|uniref:cysteine--tRNA ligase n=1 Tax=Mesorhizobium sp. SB112 TaxID=3151853 RepID=UPI00326748B5